MKIAPRAWSRFCILQAIALYKDVDLRPAGRCGCSLSCQAGDDLGRAQRGFDDRGFWRHANCGTGAGGEASGRARARLVETPGPAARREVQRAGRPAKSRYYEIARDFPGCLGNCQKEDRRDHVIVRGGPGIMEGQPGGAFEVGKSAG